MTNLTPEERSRRWGVQVWQDNYPCPDCNQAHWNAQPTDWEYTLYPDGEVRHVAPGVDGETEQVALDLCRREMADFFRNGCTPLTWDRPEVRQHVATELAKTDRD